MLLFTLLTVAFFVISTNVSLVTNERSFIDAFLGVCLPFNIWMLSGTTIIGIFICNCDITGTKELEKEYTVDSLTEKIKELEHERDINESHLKDINEELEKIYSEKEDLKNAILALNNDIRKIEAEKLTVITSLTPNLEDILDTVFTENYGADNTKDIRTRIREKDKKGE